ncbi:MAG: hypothetical protein JW884_11140 [Deltaproteobacteria bacterium]|nr:hypothetical protein [Deltaproteobacteria bacterium]
MKKFFLSMFQAAVLLFALVFTATVGVANGDPPQIYSNPVTGPHPIIDGVAGETEWQGAYRLHLANPPYQIDTWVYFLNDDQYLYVLVDAWGDDSNSDNDECLLVFGLPPAYHIVEIYGAAPTRVFSHGASGDSEKGYGSTFCPESPCVMNEHRFYEFRVDLASIGIGPGDPIAFYSPAVLKGGEYHYASMPYDAGSGGDNIFPTGLSVTSSGGDDGTILLTVEGHSTVYTSSNVSVPTFSEWGMIVFSIILAISAVFFITRRSAAI